MQLQHTRAALLRNVELLSGLAEARLCVNLAGMTFEELQRDCRVESKSIAEIESENLYEDDGRVPHVPFGFMNGQWLELKNRMQAGDELYYYVSSPKSWSNLAGREGYVLVRAGEIIDDVVTTFN